MNKTKKIFNNILKSSLIALLVVGIIYAAENIPIFNPGDILTTTRINELVNKINTLETELSNKADKTYVDSEISNVEAVLTDGIVSEKGHFTISTTGRKTWTIENVVPNKPLIISLDATANEYGALINYRILDGSNTATTPADNTYFTIAGHLSYRPTPSSDTIIPSKTTVKIGVNIDADSYGGTLYAYQ